MIEVSDVTKRFGSTLAVDGLSFGAPSGAVTGFLGPNGAGKTTTLRILLGLVRPDRGSARIDGAAYGELASARRTVGAVLDSMGFHPGRSGVDHLRIVARAADIPRRRVNEVLEIVELTGAAGRRVGGYSQGMRQRLALAAALLGDPQVLVLDEPSNGLDPAGMAWLRRLIGQWAAQGRTVLFSSHVLSEVELIADRIVIVDRGRVVREGTTSELSGTETTVVVRTPDRAGLDALAERHGWRLHDGAQGQVVVSGASAADVGQAATQSGVVLSELSSETPGRALESLFFELTGANAQVRP